MTARELCALALALPLACAAAAPAWRPDKPVEIIVNTSPGTGSDATGRLILRMLTENKLIDAPAASRLGAERALLFSEERGTLERFRPYELADAAELEALARG